MIKKMNDAYPCYATDHTPSPWRLGLTERYVVFKRFLKDIEWVYVI
jgi:hypothetical protein